MSAFRLVLLILIVGGLALFALQNLSVSLPLTFLGVKTLALPLAVWILLSIIAGILTSALIASLFQFSNYLTAQTLRREARASYTTTSQAPPKTPRYTAPVEPNPPRDSAPQPPPPSQSPPTTGFSFEKEPIPKTQTSSPQSRNDWESDWETPSPTSDDWEDSPRSTPPPTPSPTSSTQTPKTSTNSSTTYSFGGQNKKDSGVGKTEDVYDAPFRVIVPPYQGEPPKPKNDWEPSNDDEDWGLDE